MRAFSSLGEPNRRAILELVARQGPTSAGEIARHFATTPSAISQHLKDLQQAGLLSCERLGQKRIYRLDLAGFREIEDWIARTRWFWQQHPV